MNRVSGISMIGTWSYIVLFSFAFVLLVLLWIVYPPDSPWSPWWRTNKKKARAVGKFAKITNRDIVYELGSGDGECIVTIAREFHPKKAVGIEVDVIRNLMSHTRLFLSPSAQKNTQFIRRNFYYVKLSDATVVYVYLVPNAMKRLFPKLKKELKPGTRIVSFCFKIPGVEVSETDKRNKLYLYEL